MRGRRKSGRPGQQVSPGVTSARAKVCGGSHREMTPHVTSPNSEHVTARMALGGTDQPSHQTSQADIVTTSAQVQAVGGLGQHWATVRPRVGSHPGLMPPMERQDLQAQTKRLLTRHQAPGTEEQRGLEGSWSHKSKDQPSRRPSTSQAGGENEPHRARASTRVLEGKWGKDRVRCRVGLTQK